MSYAYDPIEEERRKQQQQDSQQIGGESSVVSGNQPTSGQSVGNSKGSGQYVNLQNYLNTNKNPFASDLSQKVGQDITNAQNAQVAAKNEFQKASDQGTTNLDQANIDFVTKNPYAATSGYTQNNISSFNPAPVAPKQASQTTASQTTNPPLTVGPVTQQPSGPINIYKGSTPTSSTTTTPTLQTAQAQQPTQSSSTASPFVPNYDEVNKFKAQRDAKYLGPQQFTNSSYYEPANAALNQVMQTTQALQSDSGRKSLLQKYYGTNNNRYDYNQGQQNLDMLLFGADPNAKNAIIQQTKNAQDTSNRFASLQDELNNYAKQNALKTQAARTAARGAIGIDENGGFTGQGPIQQILDATKQRSSALAKQYPTLVNDITSALFNKDISKLDQATKDKLNLQDVYSLYNLDPSNSKYLSFVKPEDITQSGVTTQDELNRLSSLSDLAGINQQWIDPSMAGKASDGLYNYNSDLFKKDLAGAKQNFLNDRRNLTTTGDAVAVGRPDLSKDIDDVFAAYNKIPSGATQLYYDRQKMLADQILNFEKSKGARDVFKAGRAEELPDIPKEVIDDALRGYIDPGFLYNTPLRQNINAFSQRQIASDLKDQYNNFISQNPGTMSRQGFTINNTTNFADYEKNQENRGMQDYQRLLDLMNGPSWNTNLTEQQKRQTLNLAPVNEDQFRKNYLLGKLTY